MASNKFNLKGGKLSDYWAQRAIGADLSKELLLSTPLPKNNLVAVFDGPPKITDHGILVRNLISGFGQQAVLPELKADLAYYPTSIYVESIKKDLERHR